MALVRSEVTISDEAFEEHRMFCYELTRTNEESLGKNIRRIFQKTTHQIDKETFDENDLLERSIVLKYPDDWRYIDILKKALKTVVQEHVAKGIKISPYLLLALDENMHEVEVDNGTIITYEDTFEHEKKHAELAEKFGHITYIYFPFFFDDSQVSMAGTIHYKTELSELPAQEALSIGLAPDYPSKKDFDLCYEKLRSLDDPFNPLWGEYFKRQKQQPKYHGRIINGQVMQEIFVKSWRQTNNATE